MPNKLVQAAAEGLPKISLPTDSNLLKAIYQYQAEWYAYLAASLDDDDAPFNYKPSLSILEVWTGPASDKMDAAEALRLALHFYEIGDSDVIPAMMKATLGFLEGGDA